MNFEEQNKPLQNAVDDPAEDTQVKEALMHFRASVRHWSEQEYARARVIKHFAWSGFWQTLASPAMAWTMSAMLLVASIGTPITIHYQHQSETARQAAFDNQKRKDAEAALRKASDAIDDESLLSGIDSDIAQATPDAMQPLASLMTDTTSKSGQTTR